MYRALLAWKQAWYLNYQQCSYVSAWKALIRLWCLIRFSCSMTLTVILQLKKKYRVIFKPFTCCLQRLKVFLVILWSAPLWGEWDGRSRIYCCAEQSSHCATLLVCIFYNVNFATVLRRFLYEMFICTSRI